MEVLRKGSKGEAVKILQGYLGVIQDGIFGGITEEAVKALQRENSLFPDGIVGPKTWAVLQKDEGFVLKRSRRRIDLILVHCTATPEGREVTVDDVRRWHMQPKEKGGLGASDLGYHYLIDLKGGIHNGRDVDKVGAHCVDHNTYSIGVVYVGGMSKDMKENKDTRTPEQKAALLDLLHKLRKLYPNAKIAGHRNYDKKGKTCPNFDAKNEYRDI